MKKLITLIILVTSSFTYSQSCGFSCLGLAGIYGGYSLVQFDASNFNSFISQQIDLENLTSNKPDFGKSAGYRFGSNIFRAEFDDYFVSTKGFYQISNENKEFTQLISTLTRIDKYNLKLNYWGVGIDFGIPLLSFIDLKLVEGGITVFDVGVEHVRTESGSIVSQSKYETTKTDVSYYVASGLIIQIIPNYVSIEGTASYNIFNIDNLEDDRGNPLVDASKSGSLIKGNKITGTVQLNIGIAF